MSGKDLVKKIEDAQNQLRRTAHDNSGDDLSLGIGRVVEELLEIIGLQQDTINWLQKRAEETDQVLRQRRLPYRLVDRCD